MKKIQWGILSVARIATEKVIPAIQQSVYGIPLAIASRSTERAADAAQRLGIDRAYGSYEELLSDPDIHAIYIPLPNHMHVPWSKRALEAGKHVLCEKPIGLNVNDAERLLQTAKEHGHLNIMEAFMYRFHPQWQDARRLVQKGNIGRLRSIHSVFSYHNTDPNNIRNKADIGGGALMDIGCYNVSLSRYLFGAEPVRVCAQMDIDPTFGTDRLVSAILDFESGMATFVCATQLHRYQRVQVLGEKGRIEIETPFNAPPEAPTHLWHQTGSTMHTLTYENVNQYTLQVDAFARAILEAAPAPIPLGDAANNMRIIDAVVQSARHNTWVTL